MLYRTLEPLVLAALLVLGLPSGLIWVHQNVFDGTDQKYRREQAEIFRRQVAQHNANRDREDVEIWLPTPYAEIE